MAYWIDSASSTESRSCGRRVRRTTSANSKRKRRPSSRPWSRRSTIRTSSSTRLRRAWQEEWAAKEEPPEISESSSGEEDKPFEEEAAYQDFIKNALTVGIEDWIHLQIMNVNEIGAEKHQKMLMYCIRQNADEHDVEVDI